MRSLLIIDTGIPLAWTLMKDGILLFGIIRANRLTNCKFLTESELKKSGRGSYEVKKATLNGIDVLAIKWMDNRLATMLTSNDSI